MATDDTKGNGTAAFGGSGSVLAAAWSEFVARALQAGGRKSADAIAQALQPAPAPGEAPGSIENLVALYREYLGDMANMLPSIARYLSGHAKPVAGRASRLLMRIRTTDELVQKVYTLSAKSVAYPRADQGAFLFFTVPAVMDPLKNALEAIPGNDSSAGNLLLALNEELNRIENLNVPAKLDEIKYEFRRHGPSALAALGELKSVFEPGYARYFAALEVVRRLLGEKVLRRILVERMLPAVGELLNQEDQKLWIPKEAMAELVERFQRVGIGLSPTISVLSGRHEGAILDHANDDIYEVKYSGTFYDIYGERESRHFTYTDDKGDQDALVPIRVMDASQGFVAWSVNKRFIQEMLDAMGTHLEAWDIGAGNTLVLLYLGDHRDGDLGAYSEIMLGCAAAPADEPLAVGLWMLGDTPVTTARARLASEAIWGFQKIPATITVQYQPRSVSCEWRDAQSHAPEAPTLLTLTLPRGGQGTSFALPLLFYSIKSMPNTSPALHRTLITRSGSGEQLRGGGAGVELWAAGNSKLGSLLHALGLVNDRGELARTPLFTAWSEHVSGEAGAPVMVTVQDRQSNA